MSERILVAADYEDLRGVLRTLGAWFRLGKHQQPKLESSEYVRSQSVNRRNLHP
jgi:hypothetical protein